MLKIFSCKVPFFRALLTKNERSRQYAKERNRSAHPDVKELLKLVNGLSSEEFQLVLGSVENMVRFANLKKRVV